MSISDDSPLIVAMDFAAVKPCLDLAAQLDPNYCRLKVGKELFTIAGPQLVSKLITMGFDIFLDLKFHDIPNTVAKAVKASADLGVWMINVHASGGQPMMEAAKSVLDDYRGTKPLLTAVTVLTSMSNNELHSVGVNASSAQQVLRLATLTKNVGLDGVVCSGHEAPCLREALGEDFVLVTPGIRPAGSLNDDQHRTMTPHQALLKGSNYLVIGRPITRAENPALACANILKEIKI